jgi:hypothetical protein
LQVPINLLFSYSTFIGGAENIFWYSIFGSGKSSKLLLPTFSLILFNSCCVNSGE